MLPHNKGLEFAMREWESMIKECDKAGVQTIDLFSVLGAMFAVILHERFDENADSALQRVQDLLDSERAKVS